MTIYIESGVYVRVNQLEGGPMPRPLQSGFSPGTAYRILGMESFSESGEAYCLLSNDRNEIWFISNRHFRVVGHFADRQELRFEITDASNVMPMKENNAVLHRPAC